MSITLIIPSLNRAAQLELLLRSLETNWLIDDLDIYIIWKATSEEYEQGYGRLMELFPESFNLEFFHEGTVFSNQIKDIIEYSDDDCIMFGTDDCVMFRKPAITPGNLDKYVTTWDDTYVGFSLRLGENTVIQNYITGELQPSLQYKEVSRDAIAWNWKRYPRNSNFGYWFSWDFHAYSKKLITSDRVFSKYFGIHRDLEHQLITDNDLYRSLPNKMLACRASSVFVNTVNTVQTDGAIPAGTKYSYTTKQLNDRFLAGERISLDSFKGQSIISCHEEFPLQWERSS